MKPHVLLMTIVALTGLYILDGPPASAQDHFRSRASGNWSDDTTWLIYTANDASWATTTDEPGDTDFAQIHPRHTITVDGAKTVSYLEIRDNASVVTGTNTLTINQDGGLFIEAGGLLNVSGNGGKVDFTVAGSNTIDGELRLSDAGALLEITADIVLGGAGMIKGTVAGAKISVDALKKLTSQMRIEGFVTIAGTSEALTGFFHNEGWVVADIDSARILLEDLTFRGRGEWRIGPSTNTAEIEFASDAKATQLAGDFVLLGENGTLDIYANVITSGLLSWLDGSIIVRTSSIEFRCN